MRNILIYKDDFFYKNILKKDEDMIEEIVTSKEDAYYSKIIPKNDGIRELKCIKNDKELYNVQKNLSNNFLANIPLPDYVTGFRSGYSYRHFLVPHVSSQKKKFYIRIDIKSFFESINPKLIEEALSYYIRINNQNTVLENIVEITTLNDELPQGAVTSPAISNIVFRPLDIRINKLAKNYKAHYTRYADDLLFSSTRSRIHSSNFIKMVAKIIGSKDFQINGKKLKKSIGELSLNGFVVGKTLRLSRKKQSCIKTILYLYNNNSYKKVKDLIKDINSNVNFKDDSFSSKEDLINYINGYRSFYISWLPNDKFDYYYIHYSNLIKEMEKLVMGIENSLT